jgi:hypothetical protein
MQAATNTMQDTSISIEELVTILIKQRDIHEGLFSLAVKFEIAVGGVGPSTESIYPGAMIGVSGFGLGKAEKPGPRIVDAAEVNPKIKSSKKKI